MTHAGRVLATLLTLSLPLGVLSACSGDDPSPGAGGPTAEGPPGGTVTEAVPTKVRVGPVVGRLPQERRRALTRQVTPLVDRWIDEKWVAGEWPREIGDDFPGFTRDATRAARRDLGVTTAADLSERVEGVEVGRRAVRLEVLAVDRRAVGVTARVALDLRTSGEAARRVSVRGRLMLTRVHGRWKVFGYDLTQGRR